MDAERQHFLKHWLSRTSRSKNTLIFSTWVAKWRRQTRHPLSVCKKLMKSEQNSRRKLNGWWLRIQRTHDSTRSDDFLLTIIFNFRFQIYERLDELDVDKAEAKAARILTGLGFTAQMQKKKLSDFSGGWRMRVSLARALFLKPYLMLLDEPTNHLDLNACVWLEQELKTYPSILVLISHSQDFLNNVCTNIIYMQQSRIMWVDLPDAGF